MASVQELLAAHEAMNPGAVTGGINQPSALSVLADVFQQRRAEQKEMEDLFKLEQVKANLRMKEEELLRDAQNDKTLETIRSFGSDTQKNKTQHGNVNALVEEKNIQRRAGGTVIPKSQQVLNEMKALAEERGMVIEPTFDFEKGIVGIKAINQEEQLNKIEEKKFSSEKDLRKEFDSLSEDYRKIEDSYNRILAVGETPSAAGDLALIFNYMKMLDPGSVVRESEFATAANAGGVPERLRSTWNNLKRGERLSQAMRQDFLARSKNLFDSQATIQQRNIDRFSGIAQRAGLDPEDVVTPIFGNIESNGIKKNLARSEGKALPKRTVEVNVVQTGKTETGVPFQYKRID